MTSFVKDLVYSQNGFYHDSELWKDDGYEVNLDKAYEEIRARLSPEINVVRNHDSYYSENVTVDVTDEMEAKVNIAGFLVLIALMLYVTWNDIARFIAPLFGG